MKKLLTITFILLCSFLQAHPWKEFNKEKTEDCEICELDHGYRYLHLFSKNLDNSFNFELITSGSPCYSEHHVVCFDIKVRNRIKDLPKNIEKINVIFLDQNHDEIYRTDDPSQLLMFIYDLKEKWAYFPKSKLDSRPGECNKIYLKGMMKAKYFKLIYE